MTRLAGWLIVGVGLGVVALGAVGVSRCTKWSGERRREHERRVELCRQCELGHKQYKSYEQYHATLRIPYVSPVPQSQWAEEFARLHVGMSENDVEHVMGKPDYARCDWAKESDRLIGSSFQYQIRVQQDDVNYRDNSWVEIFFGPDGKLKDKDAVNVQGIANRPHPGQGR